MAKRTCSVETCDRTARSGGLCVGHDKRVRKTGDLRPDVPLRTYPYAGLTGADLIARFVERRGSNACWPWVGRIDPRSGYGCVTYQGREWLVHRLAFTVAHGREPEFSIDHTCHNSRSCVPYGSAASCPHRRCCNPAHLADLPVADNAARRGDYPACPHGHAWTPETTITKANGRRACRECEREYW